MDEFQFPEDLTALDADGLAAAEQAALAEFDRLRAIGDDLTDEQVAQMEAIAAHVQEVRNEGQRRVDAVTDRRARIDAAADAVAVEDEAEEGEQPEDEAEEEVEVEEVEQPEAVAAAAARRPAPSLVRRTPQTPQPSPRRGGPTLVAAADVHGFAASQRLADLREVAKAFASRSKGLPTTRMGGDNGVRLQYPVASISRGVESFDGLSDSNPVYANDPGALIEAAGQEARLSGGSLTAAGGWCAPSETLYDLCENRASLEGLWETPEIGVTRGGIRHSQGLDFAAMFAGIPGAVVGFWQTEAQAIAGTTKACVEVTCPTFAEVRLDAVGICIKAPILTNAAWPELVRQWIEGTLIAQQHAVSGTLLARAATALGAAVPVGPTGTSVAHDTLTGLELVAEGFRQRERMQMNATLEVVLPSWVRPAIRGDLAFRTGANAQAITDEQVRAHFAARGLRVQFVYNFQPLSLSAGGVATDYPTTVNALIYPAGTFIKGTADVINLDTVYDSTDLASNVYTAAFAEEGVLLLQRCGTGAVITLNVCVSGRTGAHDSTACFVTT